MLLGLQVVLVFSGIQYKASGLPDVPTTDA